jgi:hypothetical protein
MGNLWQPVECRDYCVADVLRSRCAAVAGDSGSCVGDVVMFQFFRRFGGEVSFEQKLADLGQRMPVWFQPVWSYLVKWFVVWLREQKVQAELKEVDEQSVAIQKEWERMEYEEKVAAAERVAGQIQFENPDATVSVVPVTMGEGKDVAIMVEHPADGSKAQEVLGGAMEIRSPWVDR